MKKIFNIMLFLVIILLTSCANINNDANNVKLLGISNGDTVSSNNYSVAKQSVPVSSDSDESVPQKIQFKYASEINIVFEFDDISNIDIKAIDVQVKSEYLFYLNDPKDGVEEMVDFSTGETKTFHENIIYSKDENKVYIFMLLKNDTDYDLLQNDIITIENIYYSEKCESSDDEVKTSIDETSQYKTVDLNNRNKLYFAKYLEPKFSFNSITDDGYILLDVEMSDLADYEVQSESRYFGYNGHKTTLDKETMTIKYYPDGGHIYIKDERTDQEYYDNHIFMGLTSAGLADYSSTEIEGLYVTFGYQSNIFGNYKVDASVLDLDDNIISSSTIESKKIAGTRCVSDILHFGKEEDKYNRQLKLTIYNDEDSYDLLYKFVKDDGELDYTIELYKINDIIMNK